MVANGSTRNQRRLRVLVRKVAGLSRNVLSVQCHMFVPLVLQWRHDWGKKIGCASRNYLCNLNIPKYGQESVYGLGDGKGQQTNALK